MNKKKHIFKIIHKVYLFFIIIYHYLTSTAFITLASSALSLMLFNSWLFYQAEMDINTKVDSFFDCIWWSVTTSTTVGYGDIAPITVLGKVVGMFAMISGALMFTIFTGLFAQTLFQDEEFNQIFKD